MGQEDKHKRGAKRLANLVLVVTTLLFLTIVLFGQRAYPHVDESQVVATAFQMERLDPHPPEANWPSHTYHLLRASLFLQRTYGVLPGIEESWQEFRSDWYVQVTPLHLKLRVLPLFLGVVGLFLVYRVARFLLPPVAASVAVLFCAVSPLYARYACFALTDMTHAIWTLAALFLALRTHRRKHLWNLFFAAAATSLAVASKYLGGVAAFSVALAWFLPARTRRGHHGTFGRALLGIPVMLAGALFGLAVGIPDVFTRHEPYVNWMKTHLSSTRWVWFGFENELPSHLHALLVTFPHACGGVHVACAAALGALLSAWRRPGSTSILLLFAGLYFALVGTNDIRYTRYWVPFSPLLALFTAGFLTEVTRALPERSRRPVGGLLTLALLAGAAVQTTRWAVQTARGDTRFAFREVLEAELDAEHDILLCAHPRRNLVVEADFLHNTAYPALENPPLELALVRHSRPGELFIPNEFLTLLARKVDPAAGLAKIAPFAPRVVENGFAFDTPEAHYQALLALGVRRYLWSEWVDGTYRHIGREHYPAMQRFLDLVERNEMMIGIDPGGTLRADLPFVESEALGSSRLGAERSGPVLRLYRLVPLEELQGSGK